MSSESLRVLLEQNTDWLAEWAKDHAAGRAAGAPEINVPVAQLEAALTVIEAAKAVLPSVLFHARRVAVSREKEASAFALRDAIKAFEAAP